MVSTRSIAVSPFPSDKDGVYFAGFDVNKSPAAAWFARESKASPKGFTGS
jgi:hypothetical protein